ncbi:chemotaxis signal transduction protein [Synechococcus sp. PCC 7502]|uniref:chemotaxis protein CheW n=1 Tax=Synechococcus sp. PCC 7502 TaxID=1173263 RepID=UPI00029FEB92|nr:chemotaxis protein CheW [Synechococcus sp. PCC 7502]AFY74173.1 chemotaxis signal transduction protein [Synechococcus sp. PCC 7502]
MDSKPYLIFNLDKLQYGIDATLVKEIFLMPELTPMPEAPTDIIGMLNLRGEILPVMHLGLRLGRSQVCCQLSDQIIVLDWQGLSIGMVVDCVQDLQTIEDGDIQIQSDYGRNINSAFIAGIAKQESELLVLLNLETLIRQPDQVAAMIWEAEGLDQSGQSDDDLLFLEEIIDQAAPDELFLASATPNLEITRENISIRFGSFFDRYCPEMSLADQKILRQRAENLQVPLVNTMDSTGLYPLAIIDLGGEAFAIDLKLVQEFTSIRNLTHIPCCPQHIVGNMNLRGEIITLVDICSVLNLPSTPVKIGTKTVVVKVEDIVAGLPVNEVSDVFYTPPSEIKPVPIASMGYLQGTIALFDQTLGILDLPKMMGGLVVNDE